MEITLTIKGEATEELSKMLKAFGIALQEEPKAFSGLQASAESSSEITIKPVKTREKTNTAPPTEDGTPTETSTEEYHAVRETEEPITLEALRMQVVALAKIGKSEAIKAIFEKFGAMRLQDIKKEDYKAVAAKIAEL